MKITKRKSEILWQVVRTALTDAAGIASMLTTSEAVITVIVPAKPDVVLSGAEDSSPPPLSRAQSR